MKPNDIFIKLTIKKIRFLPTRWTGKKDQKPNMETIEEFETEEFSVTEAIKYLSKWL